MFDTARGHDDVSAVLMTFKGFNSARMALIGSASKLQIP